MTSHCDMLVEALYQVFTTPLRFPEAGQERYYQSLCDLGYCKIAVGPGNGDFGPKNVVKDYVPAPPKPATPASAPENDLPRKLKPDEFAAKHGIDTKVPMDDDIPF